MPTTATLAAQCCYSSACNALCRETMRHHISCTRLRRMLSLEEWNAVMHDAMECCIQCVICWFVLKERGVALPVAVLSLKNRRTIISRSSGRIPDSSPCLRSHKNGPQLHPGTYSFPD
eukprot:726239-Pelagomonas_calceolata.AAC.1